MSNRRRQRGFTLPEVLVTLAIVATLAAVLLPALNSQLSKGDAGRVSSDLVSLQTAIGAFTSDVRRYPKTMQQLSTAISTSDQDILNVNYPQSLVARWRGPYLSKSLVSGAMPTAFGATIQGAFTTGQIGGTGPTYLKIDSSPMTEADFNRIDLILDEAASSSTGQFQFTGTSTSGTATFYAVPIQ